jgi:hypothetical protein
MVGDPDSRSMVSMKIRIGVGYSSSGFRESSARNVMPASRFWTSCALKPIRMSPKSPPMRDVSYGTSFGADLLPATVVFKKVDLILSNNANVVVPHWGHGNHRVRWTVTGYPRPMFSSIQPLHFLLTRLADLINRRQLEAIEYLKEGVSAVDAFE